MASWDDTYAALCDHARRVAAVIAATGAERPADGAGRYIAEQSAALLSAHRPGGRPRPPGAAADALDAVARAWPAIRSGRTSGDEVFASRPELWRALMEEWPMGRYADLAAATLAAAPGPLSCVVELGAGVGAATRRLRRVMRARGGRLVATDLRYRGSRKVDFDRPLADQVPRSDAVVAVNAVHCAQDPLATLRWINESLRPGGVLVLAEGAPFPEPGVPWALNILFGPCGGWHDRGGFRPPSFWVASLRSAGFVGVERTAWPSRRYELGGALLARTPS